MAIIQKYRHLLVALVLAILVKCMSIFPNWVENVYVPHIYTPLAKAQRLLFGWLPFSLGDILYLLVIIGIGYLLFKLIQKIYKKTFSFGIFKKYWTRILTTGLYVYVVFNLFWGLNYSRKGIAHQLQIEVKKYTRADVEPLLAQIIKKLNAYADTAYFTQNLGYDTCNKYAVDCYKELNAKHSFISYSQKSVKKMMSSQLQNYMGFLGYYNPFTGEAQINHSVPKIMIPTIFLHEMAHQLGYAKEDEANFVGYLAAKESTNAYFKYSCYFDLLQYVAGELNNIDSIATKPYIKTLHPSVVENLKTWQYFRKKHESIFSDATAWIYNQFLKAADRPQGIATYNEVVALLIAYMRKYGVEAI
jgi:hypothetical protein